MLCSILHIIFAIFITSVVSARVHMTHAANLDSRLVLLVVCRRFTRMRRIYKRCGHRNFELCFRRRCAFGGVELEPRVTRADDSYRRTGQETRGHRHPPEDWRVRFEEVRRAIITASAENRTQLSYLLHVETPINRYFTEHIDLCIQNRYVGIVRRVQRASLKWR